MEMENLEDNVKDALLESRTSLDKIEKILDAVLNNFNYKSFSPKEKVDYDLFLAYVLNTLNWMHLRLNGLDPNKSDAKQEFNRIKEYMQKAKQEHERNTLRPTINKGVAGRFIKHEVGSNEPNPKRRKLK